MVLGEASGLPHHILNSRFAGPLAPQSTSPSPIVGLADVRAAPLTGPDCSNQHVISRGGSTIHKCRNFRQRLGSFSPFGIGWLSRTGNQHCEERCMLFLGCCCA